MPTNDVFKFTKTTLAALPLPPKGKRLTVKDTEVKGLNLIVTETGHKAFYVRKRINKISERILIGTYPDLPIDEARKIAMQKLSLIAQGVDLAAEKRRIRQEMTLGELYEEYMERYSKVYKKSWIYDQREITRFLSHWFNRKLSAISKADIRELHENTRKNSGLYQANRMLERIRAMYNKAIVWVWVGINPTHGIKKYTEQSRDRFIQPHEMPHFMKSLEVEENPLARDFFLLLLLTGARKTNTLMMRWDQIDWELKLWRIPMSKNGEALVLPLVDKAIEILRSRHEMAEGEWVFPRERAKTEYMQPRRAWKRVLQRATISLWSTDPAVSGLIDRVKRQYDEQLFSDVVFTKINALAKAEGVSLPVGLMNVRLHDVRRTLGSYQAISGSSLQIIGQSLGHKSLQSTQVYSRLTIEPVRLSVENAANVMFDLV